MKLPSASILREQQSIIYLSIILLNLVLPTSFPISKDRHASHTVHVSARWSTRTTSACVLCNACIASVPDALSIFPWGRYTCAQQPRRTAEGRQGGKCRSGPHVPVRPASNKDNEATKKGRHARQGEIEDGVHVNTSSSATPRNGYSIAC